MKLKMLHKNSPVEYIEIDDEAPFLTHELSVKTLQYCLITVGSDGELQLARSYAWPNGHGRSIRSVVLGHPYKVSRRMSGNANQFYYTNFNVPQNDDGYRVAQLTAKRDKRQLHPALSLIKNKKMK